MKPTRSSSAGELILVPTPIGNLGDLSPRARDVLGTADCIASEDTRVTARLLAECDLPFQKLISNHKFNERSRVEELISRLEEGQTVALCSDAGMPGISDPGEILVREAINKGIRVSALPGPNAGLTALSASGLDTTTFFFQGFLPQRSRDRKTALQKLLMREETTILYEAPHRLIKTLKEINQIGLGERRICLARELTKKYETYLYLTVAEALSHLEVEPPRGEYVLILEGVRESQTRSGERGVAFSSETKAGEEASTRNSQRMEDDPSLLKIANSSENKDTVGLMISGVPLSQYICSQWEEGQTAQSILKSLKGQIPLSRNELYALIQSLCQRDEERV